MLGHAQQGFHRREPAVPGQVLEVASVFSVRSQAEAVVSATQDSHPAPLQLLDSAGCPFELLAEAKRLDLLLGEPLRSVMAGGRGEADVGADEDPVLVRLQQVE